MKKFAALLLGSFLLAAVALCQQTPDPKPDPKAMESTTALISESAKIVDYIKHGSDFIDDLQRKYGGSSIAVWEVWLSVKNETDTALDVYDFPNLHMRMDDASEVEGSVYVKEKPENVDRGFYYRFAERGDQVIQPGETAKVRYCCLVFRGTADTAKPKKAYFWWKWEDRKNTEVKFDDSIGKQ